MMCSKLDELLDELGVSFYKNRKMYIGKCPIHCGDNNNAINLYREGDTRPGYWVCNTKHCHNTFKKTIIGFVRGVLSKNMLDWDYKNPNSKLFGWNQTIDWCSKFLGTPIQSIEIDKNELEKIRFSNEVSKLTQKVQESKNLISKADVRKFLKIPSEYFVKRGFTREVLDKYDVGEYTYLNKPLSNRAVVPIYDNTDKFAVGFTGRNILQNDQCKWYNHKFSRESILYNYSKSKDFIQKSRTALLVEGPGDIWRLTESGIQNTVALLGSSLSDQQQIILEMSGVMNLIVLTDMDDAGNSARDEIRKKLSRSFRLHFPLLKKHDIGQMSVQEIQQDILPIIKAIK